MSVLLWLKWWTEIVWNVSSLSHFMYLTFLVMHVATVTCCFHFHFIISKLEMIWWVWCFHFCVLRDGLFIAAVNSLYQYDFVCKDESKRILYQCWSPRAHLQWWGCSGLCLWHKPTKLAHSFLFCSCVCFFLYGPFNCISFHKFSQQPFAFSFCCCGINSALLVLSTVYLFMKVSLSPHIILCGWLGLKHQLTKYQCA